MLRHLDDARAFCAVILDMDGVMLDSEVVEMRAWQRAAADFDWSISYDEYLQLIGKTDREATEVLTAWWEARPGGRGGLDDIRERADRYGAEETPAVKAGLLELIDWAHREGVPLAVGSSSSRDTIRTRLAAAGVRDDVDAIAGGDEVVRGKPAPDVFLLAAERLGCEPHLCVVIEDSDHGINAAEAAGMTSFLVPDSSIPRDIPPEIRTRAYRTCGSLGHVLDILEAAAVR